jgi:hypothetical protein
MEQLFSPMQWQKLRDLEFDAFVVMDADIREDGTLRLGKVRERYPNASWDYLAGAFGSEANLRAATVGSHIDPPAEVCVVFFKKEIDGSLVLIFAQQKNDPPVGMNQKATFLHTEYYHPD